MDPTKGLTHPKEAKPKSRRKMRRPKGLAKLTFRPKTSSLSDSDTMPLPTPEDNIFKSPTSEGCEKIQIILKLAIY